MQDLPKSDNHSSFHTFVGIIFLDPAPIARLAVVVVGVEEGVHRCPYDGGTFADMVVGENGNGDPA